MWFEKETIDHNIFQCIHVVGKHNQQSCIQYTVMLQAPVQCRQPTSVFSVNGFSPCNQIVTNLFFF